MAHNVHVIDHPLVQHKLTLLRKKETSTTSFRRLLNEIGSLMAYEVTREVSMHEVLIRQRWTGPHVSFFLRRHASWKCSTVAAEPTSSLRSFMISARRRSNAASPNSAVAAALALRATASSGIASSNFA